MSLDRKYLIGLTAEGATSTREGSGMYYSDALAEAKRRAEKSPGHRWFVYEIVAKDSYLATLTVDHKAIDVPERTSVIAGDDREDHNSPNDTEGGGVLLETQSPSVDDEVRNQAEDASPEVASEGEATGKVTMRVELPEGFVAWNGASADLPNPDIAPTTLVVTMRRNADFELTIAGDCDWEWAEALERIVPEFEELHDPAEDIIAYKIAVAGVDYETSGYAHVGESSASESDDDRTPAVDGPFASTADLSRSFGHSDVEAESIERGVNAILNRGRFASIETPAEAERTEVDSQSTEQDRVDPQVSEQEQESKALDQAQMAMAETEHEAGDAEPYEAVKHGGIGGAFAAMLGHAGIKINEPVKA